MANEVDRRTLGDQLVIVYDNDPRDVNDAPQGSISVDTANARMYIATSVTNGWTDCGSP